MNPKTLAGGLGLMMVVGGRISWCAQKGITLECNNW